MPAISYLGWIIQPEPSEGVCIVVNEDETPSDFQTMGEAQRYVELLSLEKEAA
jgi:hypothetical protein